MTKRSSLIDFVCQIPPDVQELLNHEPWKDLNIVVELMATLSKDASKLCVISSSVPRGVGLAGDLVTTPSHWSLIQSPSWRLSTGEAWIRADEYVRISTNPTEAPTYFMEFCVTRTLNHSLYFMVMVQSEVSSYLSEDYAAHLQKEKYVVVG